MECVAEGFKEFMNPQNCGCVCIISEEKVCGFYEILHGLYDQRRLRIVVNFTSFLLSTYCNSNSEY